MWNQKIHKISNIVFVSALAAAGLYGCGEKQGYSVLAATGTVIGVEVSQNPATQIPQGKLGYNRSELAFVPTNRSGGKEPGGFKEGAPDTADVIMELRYGGIFDTGGSSGIYQRLAVGKNAVKEPGAAFMFAKDADGTLKSDTAKAVASTMPTLQTLPKVGITTKQSLTTAIGRESDLEKIKKAIKQLDPNAVVPQNLPEARELLQSQVRNARTQVEVNAVEKAFRDSNINYTIIRE